MTRDVRWYLVGSLVLVTLAGCGRTFFAQREAWRREAEVQCLKSGAVREGPAVAMLSPITGPGVCGVDFPLKVAALGDAPALGYADESARPPGAIRRGSGRAAAVGRPGASLSPAPLELAPPETTAGDPVVGASAYPPRLSSYRETTPLAPAAPVQAASVAAVTPAATLACPVVSALDRWVAEAIQPAAQRWFGQPVTEIKQISAYSCRGMNGNSRARISEHAFGNAFDVSAFTLADGRVVSVARGWRGAPEEQGFLRDVQAAACGIFNTVLAPGSNRFHYDHIHVDLMRRDSGRSICEPEATSGEAVASRARQRGGYAASRPGDFAVTGTLSGGRRGEPPPPRPPTRIEDLIRAIPGED